MLRGGCFSSVISLENDVTIKESHFCSNIDCVGCTINCETLLASLMSVSKVILECKSGKATYSTFSLNCVLFSLSSVKLSGGDYDLLSYLPVNIPSQCQLV